MANENNISEKNATLKSGDFQQAYQLIEEKKLKEGVSAALFYEEGKLLMKQARWGEAISCFLKAEELDAASPARQCRQMLDDIMAFYNKDMYNQ